ncbi:hypothetical protein DES34_11552 [Brevibacillus brevis]|nr:hypothetical protein DES34_11552 [Brevibacillus brevis]VEF87460.1 Uncharacterised protein [Brevibacillus brevis]
MPPDTPLFAGTPTKAAKLPEAPNKLEGMAPVKGE